MQPIPTGSADPRPAPALQAALLSALAAAALYGIAMPALKPMVGSGADP